MTKRTIGVVVSLEWGHGSGCETVKSPDVGGTHDW